ncbi:hypothetical protein [uncultured Tateyamaria sp.]|uniref:hypothetical protein n=1 Tax=uncultured Tateyamaria sp. TaxID=455651 RepID=UPI0026203148|nr:hypothetical protein [uncultured Tateyamaria sp.]
MKLSAQTHRKTKSSPRLEAAQQQKPIGFETLCDERNTAEHSASAQETPEHTNLLQPEPSWK